MNAIVQTFNRARVLLPVVHCCDEVQATSQALLAREHGADGVFLINQGGLNAEAVVHVALNVMAASPGWFVGVNLLGRDGIDLGYLARDLDGVWEDSADPELADVYPGLYFGGVAFKYQAPVHSDLLGSVALRAARQGISVVTTSGPATGEPAPIEKVQVMRSALGDHALALASGITPENVGEFLPYVDAYLVASGIERSFGEFDPARLRALADTVHGFKPAK